MKRTRQEKEEKRQGHNKQKGGQVHPKTYIQRTSHSTVHISGGET